MDPWGLAPWACEGCAIHDIVATVADTQLRVVGACLQPMLGALTPLVMFRRPFAILATVTFSALVAASWPAPIAEPERPQPEPPATYTLVPLLGMSLDFAVDEADGELGEPNASHPEKLELGGCLPFLQPLIAHPNWQLQLVSASSHCTGTTIHDRYVVDSFGHVAWTRPNMPPRKLELSRAELERIRHLDRLDCVRTEEVNFGEAHYRISLAGLEDGDGGAHISQSSTMARELETIFEAAKQRYRTRRLAELGTFTLRLRANPNYSDHTSYRIDLVGSRLTISHHTRVLHAVDVETNDLVEVVDRLEAPREDIPSARGWLRSGNVTRAVALPTTVWGDFWDVVLRGIAEASYREDPSR